MQRTVEVCFPGKRRVFLPAVLLALYRIADSERHKKISLKPQSFAGMLPSDTNHWPVSPPRKPNAPEPDGVPLSAARMPPALCVHFTQGRAARSPEAAVELHQQQKKGKKLNNGDTQDMRVYNPFMLRGRLRVQVPTSSAQRRSCRPRPVKPSHFELRTSGHQH